MPPSSFFVSTHHIGVLTIFILYYYYMEMSTIIVNFLEILFSFKKL